MQGLFIHGSRPKTKKELKTVVAAAQDPEQKPEESGHLHDLYCVALEATSWFGNEYDGSLENAPKIAKSYYVVGPDPHTSRKWYANITWNANKLRWEVK